MRRWYLVAAAVCTGWATVPLVLRELALPAAATAFGRTAIAAAGLGALLLVDRDRGRPRLLSVQPARCVLTAAVLGIHWLAEFAAYTHAPAGTVILIVYLAPIGVAATAPLVLRERLQARSLVALSVAVTGFVLLAGPAASRAGWVGLGWALLAMVTFVALVLLSKPLAEIYGGVRLSFLEMAGAAIVLLPFAARASWGAPRAGWAWLVVLGLVHTALGLSLYFAALGHLPATHFGIIGYLEPAAVVLFAWALLGERPAATSMLGGVLVLAAGGLVVATPPPAVEAEAVLVRG